MVHFRGILTHWVFTPVLYYLWGRPRLTVQAFLQAHRNLDHALQIYCPVQYKLEVVFPLLEPCEIRRRAAQLHNELQSEIEGLCSESVELNCFWHSYGGIRSRLALTALETRRGLDMFAFWTEGDAWRRLAWAKREAAEAGWVTCKFTGMILYMGWRLTQLFQLKHVPNVQGHSLPINDFETSRIGEITAPLATITRDLISLQIQPRVSTSEGNHILMGRESIVLLNRVIIPTRKSAADTYWSSYVRFTIANSCTCLYGIGGVIEIFDPYLELISIGHSEFATRRLIFGLKKM